MFYTPPLLPICTRCLRSLSRPPIRRLLTTSAPAPPPPPTTGHALLTTRRLISVSGPDAPRFLQGLTTANIPSVAPSAGTGFYSAFLTAAGRVLHDVFIYGASKPDDDSEGGFLIEIDAHEVRRLEQHLRRFQLRAKIAIRVLDEGERGVWAVWGNAPRAPTPSDQTIGCEDTRAPGMGSRLVLRADEKPACDDAGEPTSVATYTVRRMLRGVAEGQSEIPRDAALPLESNLDLTRGIDFRKGCYLGQELTIRTHHTGVVRKRILPVRLYDAAGALALAPPRTLAYDPTCTLPAPPPGANIRRAQPKSRSAGKWLAGTADIGLALCRLELMTDVVLTDGGTTWVPDHEFRIESALEVARSGSVVEAGITEIGALGVKAFVPDWLRSRRKLGEAQARL